MESLGGHIQQWWRRSGLPCDFTWPNMVKKAECQLRGLPSAPVAGSYSRTTIASDIRKKIIWGVGGGGKAVIIDKKWDLLDKLTDLLGS